MFYLNNLFQDLFAKNSLCRKFIASSPDVIVITNEEGIVLAGNSRAAEMFGYVDEATIPLSVNDNYKYPEDRERLMNLLSSGEVVKDFEAEVLDRDGNSIFTSISVSAMDVGGMRVFVAIVRDISERKKTQLNEIRFETLATLSGMADADYNQIYDFALEAAVRITRSEIGYIYFVNEDESELRLYAWSRKVMPQCSVELIPDIYHVKDVGIWGEAIRQRRPMILNDYAACGAKKGLPKGHVPIKRHMNVPLFDDGKIVLLVGVGNKEDEYDDEDVRQLTLMMDGMWNIVRRKQADEALRQAYAEMEGKVEERTKELRRALGDLRQVNSAMANEVGQRRLAEQRLRQFERLVELSPDMVSLLDSDYRYVMVNDSYVRFFDKPKEYFLGRPVYEVTGKDVFDDRSKKLIDSAFAGQTTGFEAWVDLPLVGKRFFSVTYHPVDSVVGDGRLVSITAHDITEQKEMLEEVKRLASTDYLTGAHNRRHFMSRAETELDRLTRYGGELYLMMLDIDHFKNINDTYGHSVGDVVLKEMVKCCIETLRTSDVFGRLGGEEFAALLVHGSIDSAIQVAERLREAIEDMEVRIGRHVVKLTVSIGLTMVCADEDIEIALKHADKCLYQAKEQGRNRVVSYCKKGS
ncbi:diguanylate cyclase with PAS/PAC and GAF sensors [Maridesulfovibrio salexigens DSM 2638]|uniref:diguanylate cyclase n=1 Tax=Maridesulfovibrio salexigens (strain ATCC 14822 / DSM 2638 / NCIMB 8403 / VKM B-1763) TaxID=526222 RepID=C6BZS4_MARSD|nr:diguanylate cyclase with PAS/PAC and GAF sensors [Maridesulfovibrio salexigens DSM 2638]